MTIWNSISRLKKCLSREYQDMKISLMLLFSSCLLIINIDKSDI